MNAMTQDFPVTTTEWLVLGCSPSRTLALVAGLRNRGAWVPTWTRRRRLPRSSIFRLVTEPVIPGMVFVPSFSLHDLPAVPRVPYWIMHDPLGDLMRVPDRQMEGLRKIADKPLVPASLLPKVGRMVRFTEGPFEGMQGKLIDCTIRAARVAIHGIHNPVTMPPSILQEIKLESEPAKRATRLRNRA